MTKKQIYFFSVEVAQATLRTYFNTVGFDNLARMKGGKEIIKAVYDKLEPVLLTKES